MGTELLGLRIAILVVHGFEQIELLSPRWALDAAGATTEVVSSARDLVWGWDFNDWGDSVAVDKPLAQADPSDYHALLLPGGLMNADALRLDPAALAFIQEFSAADKPVATIRHAAWSLIDAGLIHGQRLTSWPSMKRDLINAGADWTDEPVVYDAGLISCRLPSDLPHFNRVLLRVFAQLPITAGEPLSSF